MKIKSAEESENDLFILIGRIAYLSDVKDWKRIESMLKEHDQQIQLNTIQATMEYCSKSEPTKGFADQFDSDAQVHAYLNGWSACCDKIKELSLNPEAILKEMM